MRVEWSYPLVSAETTFFRGCDHPCGRVFIREVISLKLLAFVTASSMLLGTYVLATLRRRLGGVLEGWQSDPVAVLPTATSSK